ncbi:MAG: hypothetical protein WA734_03925, partial [Candidatus Acidiferrales bacterium]
MNPAAASTRETELKTEVRHDWTRGEIRELYELPLTHLLFRAQTVHRSFHKADEIQMCRLLSIKTGGCPE